MSSNEIYDKILSFFIPVEDILVLIVVSLALGFALGFFYVKAQITAIEDRYRAELERWKVENGAEIRKESVNRLAIDTKGKDCRAAR